MSVCDITVLQYFQQLIYIKETTIGCHEGRHKELQHDGQ